MSLPTDDMQRKAFCTSYMGISRAKYEYQKVNRILKAWTSTDRQTPEMEDQLFVYIGWSFKGMPAARMDHSYRNRSRH